MEYDLFPIWNIFTYQHIPIIGYTAAVAAGTHHGPLLPGVNAHSIGIPLSSRLGNSKYKKNSKRGHQAHKPSKQFHFSSPSLLVLFHTVYSQHQQHNAADSHGRI